MPQKAAKEVARTIQSAAANAENNFEMDAGGSGRQDDLADEGPAFKRFMPACPWPRRPYSQAHDHITVIVDDGEEI